MRIEKFPATVRYYDNNDNECPSLESALISDLQLAVELELRLQLAVELALRYDEAGPFTREALCEACKAYLIERREYHWRNGRRSLVRS